MFRQSALGLAISVAGLLAFAKPSLASDSLEFTSPACRANPEVILKALTITPFSDVVVGGNGEFKLTKEDDSVTITHIGPSKNVRLVSVVAVGSKVKLVLSNPETDYCIISAVAVLNGSLSIEGLASQISIESSVGNITL